MSIQGYLVGLSSHSYEAPSCCASCMGARETQVEANVSEKSGNIRTTLKMAFPYCNACAKRARFEKVRQVLVGGVAAVLGVALAIAAWSLDVGVETAIRFALALPLAAGLAAALAFVTRGSLPAAPATARGEAVILRDTSGTVLCTNPHFAHLLAQANGTTARPAAQHMTVEVWAPVMAMLCGVLVLLAWVKEGAPDTSTSTSAGPSAKASASAMPSASASAMPSASASAPAAAPSSAPVAKPASARQTKPAHATLPAKKP